MVGRTRRPHSRDKRKKRNSEVTKSCHNLSRPSIFDHLLYLSRLTYGCVAMSLEQPLTEQERTKLKEIMKDPEKIDSLLDKALKGWRRGKSWTKQTRK